MSVHGIHPPARRRPGRLSRAAVLLIPPLFVFSGWLIHRQWEYQRAVHAIFGDAALGPYRRSAARLSYAPAARHRPFSAPCQKDDCAPTLRHTHLARLERAGDIQGLAAAYALSGDFDRALKLLDTLPSTADIESDRAALLSHDPRRTPDAFTAADRALRLRPDHPVALWNRGLLMENLGLPLAGARAFRAVEKLGEPGWGAEARQRAERLEGQWRERVAAFRRAEREMQAIPAGTPPSSDTTKAYPDLLRMGLITAIRERKNDALIDRFRSIAASLDAASGTRSLVNLVERQELLRLMKKHMDGRDISDADEYQRLAEVTGEPWLMIRGHHQVGKALLTAGRGREGEAALGRAVAACERWAFPRVCLDIRIWLAYYLVAQRDLPAARRHAVQAKEGTIRWAIPSLEAAANGLLATLEDERERFSMARAYAEEAALQGENCEAANNAREQLAKIALGNGDENEARVRLKAITRCQASPVRFQIVGTEALSVLARDPGTGSEEFSLFQESVAAHRAARGMPRWHDLALRLFSARAMLARDRDRARADLEALAGIDPAGDEAVQMVKLQASSALMVGSAAAGDFAGSLRGLEQAHDLPDTAECVLAVATSDGEWAYVARGRTRDLHGAYLRSTPVTNSVPPVPEAVLSPLRDCNEIAVLASAPVLGRSRLLPDDVAWAYVTVNRRPEPFGAEIRRVVIWDVQPPAELGLQRLLAVPLRADIPGHAESTKNLRGPQATPDAVRDLMPEADLLEWHVHGIVDPEVSDAAALVLSPDEQGRALLTGRELLEVRLPRHPGVVLGACRAGLSARYGAFQWSLPLAFLRSGARWVIAAPTPVEDAEGPAFLTGVWRRIILGATPAVALRDERMSRRWRESYRQWTKEVVLFH